MTPSQDLAYSALDDLLADFGLDHSQADSKIQFVNNIPPKAATKSQHINLTLVGAIPSAANALVAARIFEQRGGEPQTITIDLRKSHNYIDPDIGMTPSINGQEIPHDVVVGNPFLRNIFQTKDGRHVVISAVYVDLVYKWTAFLGCSVLESSVRETVKNWNSNDLEEAAEKAGLPLALVQSEDGWLTTAHGKHISDSTIVPIKRATNSPCKELSRNPRRPLEGVKVLCCTHAIAGPSAGRTLAEHGASVLQVMFTHGFEHSFVYTYANLGCASTRLNLHKAEDRERLWDLIKDANVWIDSYREGAIARFGYSDVAMFTANPSLIISHVRCYGTTGPWSDKPGFDMQGSASSGLMAYCCGSLQTPAWPPGMVINDYTTGYYGALAIQVALLRQFKEGGGYLLSPSLTGTAMSILRHFKSSELHSSQGSQDAASPPDTLEGWTGYGYLKTLKPLPVMSKTPIKYDPVLLVSMGSSPPYFPGFPETAIDVTQTLPRSKEEFVSDVGMPFLQKLDHVARIGKRWRNNTSSI